MGNATLFPRWQFQDGDVRSDLGDILEAPKRFSTDPVAADRVMRLPRDDLHGRSIGEALDHPRNGRAAWRLLAAAGGAD